MAQTTIIITGANRGIGLSCVKLLVQNPPVTPLHIIACARKPPTPSPTQDTKDVSVHWHALDTTSSESISTLVSDVKSHHPDGVDVLINNAGLNVDINADPKEKLENAKKTCAVNFDGTIKMMQAILPLLKKKGESEVGPRIANVASIAGRLNSGPYSTAIADKYKSASSLADLYNLQDAYLKSVASDAEEKDGWPTGKSYCVSKALVCAATKVMAEENPGVLINSCCPGWCDSDMGSLTGKPGKTTDEGARIPLNLAFGKVEGVSGKYWENDSVHSAAPGKVSEWMNV